MTGRVDILRRIFDKSAKKIKIKSGVYIFLQKYGQIICLGEKWLKGDEKKEENVKNHYNTFHKGKKYKSLKGGGTKIWISNLLYTPEWSHWNGKHSF